MGAQGEATELIALLDRIRIEEGSFTSHNPDIKSVLDDIARSSSPFADHDLPPSLAIYPNISLAAHLEQHDQDLAKMQRLHARAAALSLDRNVVVAATKLLDAEHLLLDASLRDPAYDKTCLRQKLKFLRAAQEQARHPGPTREETFSISAVPGIETNGTPSKLVKYDLPLNISWTGFQEALRDMTKGWQAREAGFANGYSLKYGKWLYLVSKDGVPEKVPRDLTCEAEYKAMREMLKNLDIFVVVWHQRIWGGSQAARGLWAEILKEEEERPEDDWLKVNGWEPFQPGLDPDFDASDEWDIFDGMNGMGEVRAPNIEPLSDREDDGVTLKRQANGDDVQEHAVKKARVQAKPQMRLRGRRDAPQ